MKYWLIFIVFVALSCHGKDLKKEIEIAFEKKDMAKITDLLNEYYQVNGTDLHLERSYVQLALLKGDLNALIKIYHHTPYMALKKDKDLLQQISAIIIDKNQKITVKKRLKFYKNAIRAFPYAEPIYNAYIEALIEVKEIKKAFVLMMQYDEVFNQENKYLKKVLFLYLKHAYLQKEQWLLLDYIAKINSKEAITFLENLIQEKEGLIQSINTLPQGFNKALLVQHFKSKRYGMQKASIRHFLLLANQKEVDEHIKPLYKKLSQQLQLLIYVFYYEKFNQEIDSKLIPQLLKSDDVMKQRAAIHALTQLKLKKYAQNLRSMIGDYASFSIKEDAFLVDALLALDSSYLQDFNEHVIPKDLIEKITKQELLNAHQKKATCSFCLEAYQDKNTKPKERARLLQLLIKSTKDLSFLKEGEAFKKDFITYRLLLKNKETLSQKEQKELAYMGYQEWKDTQGMISYLEALTLEDIQAFFQEPKIKAIPNKYLMKLLYYAFALRHTELENDAFKQFIVKKGVKDTELLNHFHFNKKHLSTLLQAFLRENNTYKEINLIKKIVNIVTKE